MYFTCSRVALKSNYLTLNNWIKQSFCFLFFNQSCHFFCLRLTRLFLPASPTFQPWRNLDSEPPLSLTRSHLTRSITLCLFQLKLTPFPVRRIVTPCRNATHLCCTHCPGGFQCSWIYIMLLQEDLCCQMDDQTPGIKSSR